jgi:hypothetical protein
MGCGASKKKEGNQGDAGSGVAAASSTLYPDGKGGWAKKGEPVVETAIEMKQQAGDQVAKENTQAIQNVNSIMQ